jgi:hypothetical protein
MATQMKHSGDRPETSLTYRAPRSICSVADDRIRGPFPVCAHFSLVPTKEQT